jgi:hypothetical protein
MYDPCSQRSARKLGGELVVQPVLVKTGDLVSVVQSVATRRHSSYRSRRNLLHSGRAYRFLKKAPTRPRSLARPLRCCNPDSRARPACPAPAAARLPTKERTSLQDNLSQLALPRLPLPIPPPLCRIRSCYCPRTCRDQLPRSVVCIGLCLVVLELVTAESQAGLRQQQGTVSISCHLSLASALSGRETGKPEVGPIASRGGPIDEWPTKQEPKPQTN